MAENSVLIIDDDENIVELLRVNLAKAGYRVMTAFNGEAGVALALRELPHLVILDIMMPRMDGYEVCCRLRGNERTHLLPIIVLSARDSPVDKITGLKLGADEYLTKPFDMEELLVRVESLILRTGQCLAANPLTGLPGNVSILYEANRRLRAREAFAFLYLDLDNFKPYNDVYGFSRGDSVIQFVSTVVQACTTPDNFIGHIGGDDFIVIARLEDGEDLCQRILRQFDAGIRAYYNPEDITRGYVTTKDRRNVVQKFPLMTLSIGLVLHHKEDSAEYVRIVEIATELKKAAKNAQNGTGSVYLTNRRR